MNLDLIALDKKLDRIERKISMLIAEKKTERWVKVSVIQKVTGWDSEWLKKARANGLVKYRKNDKRVFEYLLESIPEVYIIKPLP
jgi:hypothetical protein